MQRKKLAALILTFALALASGAVFATVIIQDGDFLVDLDGFGENVDITKILSFDKFDPALGMLTEVEVDFLVLFDKLHDIENLDSNPQMFAINASSQLTISLSNLAGYELDDADNLAGTFLLDGFDIVAMDLFTDIIQTLSFTSPADLAAFIGTGESFDVLSLAQGEIDIEPTALAAVSSFGDFDGFVTLTYQFSKIPEPASLALMCMGLLGLAIRRWR